MKLLEVGGRVMINGPSGQKYKGTIKKRYDEFRMGEPWICFDVKTDDGPEIKFHQSWLQAIEDDAGASQ
jgi:hypothetical protein